MSAFASLQLRIVCYFESDNRRSCIYLFIVKFILQFFYYFSILFLVDASVVFRRSRLWHKCFCRLMTKICFSFSAKCKEPRARCRSVYCRCSTLLSLFCIFSATMHVIRRSMFVRPFRCTSFSASLLNQKCFNFVFHSAALVLCVCPPLFTKQYFFFLNSRLIFLLLFSLPFYALFLLYFS